MNDVEEESLPSNKRKKDAIGTSDTSEVSNLSTVRKIINIIGIPLTIFIIFSLVIFPFFEIFIFKTLSGFVSLDSESAFWLSLFVTVILALLLFIVLSVVSAILVWKTFRRVKYALLALLILPAIFIFNITLGTDISHRITENRLKDRTEKYKNLQIQILNIETNPEFDSLNNLKKLEISLTLDSNKEVTIDDPFQVYLVYPYKATGRDICSYMGMYQEYKNPYKLNIGNNILTKIVIGPFSTHTKGDASGNIASFEVVPIFAINTADIYKSGSVFPIHVKNVIFTGDIYNSQCDPFKKSAYKTKLYQMLLSE